jgi:ankyrin repeat protein
MVLANVDVNVTDYDGRSALHLAASEGKVDAVRALLVRGASIDLRDRWGGLARDDAQRYHHTDVAVLLRPGGCAGDGSRIAETTADAATDGALGDSVDAGVGANPTQTTTGTTELLAAARLGDLSEIKRLKKKQVDLNATDYDGRSALHVAAAAGHLDAVVYLVNQKQANINVQDNFNHTPLNDAVRGSHLEVVAWLKQNGIVLVFGDKNRCSRMLPDPTPALAETSTRVTASV